MSGDLKTRLLTEGGAAQDVVDEQDVPTDEASQHLDWKRAGREFTKWVLILMASTIVVLLAVFVALFHLQAFRRPNGLCSSSEIVEEPVAEQGSTTFYGKNLPYTLLDHKFDHLWDPKLSHGDGVVGLPRSY